MDIFATLRRSGGIDALARQTGMTPPDAARGVEALLPALIGGFRRTVEIAGGGMPGIARLVAMIDARGGGEMAASVLHPDPLDSTSGEALLGGVLGRKEISRAIAARAGEATGLESSALERVLPVLAMLVGGYLSARAQIDGAQGGGLDALAGALDLYGDGNPLDDVTTACGSDGRLPQ